MTFMPFFKAAMRDRRVGVVRRHHLDRRDVLLLLQQLAEVHVGGAPPSRLVAPLLRVEGVHDLLADVSPARHVVEALAPRGIPDEAPDGVSDLVPAPLEVVDAVSLDVADGDDLDLGAGEHAADLPDGLGAEADAGQRDLVARRDEPRPAEDAPRHDRDGGGRCRRAGEELASIHVRCHGAGLQERENVASF